MSDTLAAAPGVTTDPTPQYRLTDEAVERARRVFGLRRKEDIAARLGISRRSFFRLLDGTYPISLGQAANFADQIGWPIGRAFKPCDDADMRKAA